MNRLIRCFVSISAIVMTTPMSRVSAAEGDVVLPCPTFKTGNSWLYTMSFPMASQALSQIVLAVNGKTILLGTKTIAKVGPDSHEIVTSQETEYEDTGSAIVQKSFKTSDVQTSFEQGEPVCGTIPGQRELTTKFTLNGVTTFTRSTVSTRVLGKEKVTVPAGTFDATVIEIRRQVLPSEQSPSTASSPRTAQVIYAVEGVGIVKVLKTSTYSGPLSAATMDPEAKALIEEGVRKMQAGQDASDEMKKLSTINRDAHHERHGDEVRTELTMELQSFVVNH